ncbi:MAG: hypothetical protein KAS72_12440 [Phycisphaerales bacterium]|nr:hypothetical protein [Phycisphaerales bacterium]
MSDIRKLLCGTMLVALAGAVTSAAPQPGDSTDRSGIDRGSPLGGDGTILALRDCVGDVDGDGDTDEDDLTLLEDAFGSVPGDPNWNPDADLDGDGDVDMADLAILMADMGCGGSGCPCNTECPGDVDCDGDTDQDDLDLVYAAFGSVPGDPNWNPCADLDGDGDVDQVDMGIVQADFGCGGGDPCPCNTECPGDIDCDGDTDYDDHALVLDALYSSPGDPNWNPCADLDGDDYVSAADLGMVLADTGCPFSACAGDVDGDGDTDQIDLALVEDAFGSVYGDPNWNADADLDFDGDVDSADLDIVLGDIGCGIPDCVGDVDGDGKTDQIDLDLLLDAFGSVPGDPNWNPDADLDGDGDVDIDDLDILLANYGCARMCEGDLDGDRDTDQSDLGILLGAYELNGDGDLDGDGDTDQSDLGILLGNYDCWVPE